MVPEAIFICAVSITSVLILYLFLPEQLMHDITDTLFNEFSANSRSNRFMRDILSQTEYDQVRKTGYLEVLSPNFEQRKYRIPRFGGLVEVVENGRRTMELCLQPVQMLPAGDVVVMHKLMIEANEIEYLARANHFVPYYFF